MIIMTMIMEIMMMAMMMMTTSIMMKVMIKVITYALSLTAFSKIMMMMIMGVNQAGTTCGASSQADLA